VDFGVLVISYIQSLLSTKQQQEGNAYWEEVRERAMFPQNWLNAERQRHWKSAFGLKPPRNALTYPNHPRLKAMLESLRNPFEVELERLLSSLPKRRRRGSATPIKTETL
jgi:hypothetical protein